MKLNMKHAVFLLQYATNVLSEIDRRDGVPNYFTNVNHGRMDYFTVLMYLEEITLDECIKSCMRHLRCWTVTYSSSARLCELNDMEFDEIEAIRGATGWVNYGTPAKIDGGYSDWTNNTACSHTCGKGHVTYYRSCDNPKPQHGGADCDGDEMKIEPCFLRCCPSLYSGACSLVSKNYPNHAISFRSDQPSDVFMTTSSNRNFKIVPAYNGVKGVYSLEPMFKPGFVLNIDRWQVVYMNKNHIENKDGASFYIHKDKFYEGYVALEPYTLKKKFLRHSNYKIWAHYKNNGKVFKQDASWKLVCTETFLLC